MVHHTIDSQQKHNDLDDLKARFKVRDYARAMLGEPKRSTPARDTYFAPHRDDGSHPSFTVYADGFKDYGSGGAQGSGLDLIMLLENLTTAQAIERLQNLVGSHPVNAPRPQRQERPAANEPPPANWQYIAAQFVEAAQRELWRNEPALNYLRYERLLTDETIRAAGLGWNPEARKIGGFWVEAGIVIPRYQDGTLWLVNIRTVTGSFAAFMGIPSATRRNGEPIDKYICMAGSKLIGSLFNADTLQPGRPVLAVEGEFDAILAEQELGEAVSVVTPGGATNRITPTWKARLLALDVPIYIALDSDSAGTDATRHLIMELGEKATALKYPAGIKDLTDFVNAGGDTAAWFTAQTNRRVFADGAPVSWVSAMKTHMRPGAALLFVAMQNAARIGAIDPQRFTAPELLDWMHENDQPIAKRTFYSYLESCEGELVQKGNTYSLTTEGYKDNVLHFGTNPGGAPADTYCMVELPQLQKAIGRQSWARLYDQEFKTDGKRGIKGRPRIAQLKAQGIPNPGDVAAKLDKAYEPIYRRQKWAHKYAEKRIQEKHAVIVASLADLTPIKTAGHLIKRQSDLEPCIIETRLQENTPTSQKEIARWIGKDRAYVGKVLAQMGRKGIPSEKRVIHIKPGQDIKKTAIEADPHARWIGVYIDDNPEMQAFNQDIAKRATKSVAVVIQPAYTYIKVDKPEPEERPVAAPKQNKIDVSQSKAASKIVLAPYWGDDVSPEVDHNQLVLGLHGDGWEFNQATRFWYHAASGNSCRTMTEAIQLQAGIAIEPAPTVDSAPKQPEKRENIDPAYVESNEPENTPQTADFFIEPETWFADIPF